MFSKNANNAQMEAIKEGGIFHRQHSHNMIETARVLAVDEDQFGIPHVKYEVKFEYARESGRAFEGPRILALAVFADNYRFAAEPV